MKVNKNHVKPKLDGSNYKRAIKLLFYVVDFMDRHDIDYHLEGGTLLGIVRDGDLLPWDYDLDVSICSDQVEKFKQHSHELTCFQYKLKGKPFFGSYGALHEGAPRIFKVKPRIISFLKEFSEFFRKKYINIDIFIKYSDEKYTYWQAEHNALKVDKKFYEGFDEIEFMGRKLKIPLNHSEYLESKYGDWKTPVKEWDCGIDENTICGRINPESFK
jgi:phosphorylcholine metabolism protein LicD